VVSSRKFKKIGKDSPEAISLLVDFIRNSGDEFTRGLAAGSLGEIGKDSPEAISALVDLIANSQNEETRRQAQKAWGKSAKIARKQSPL
jgi:HEAT repeat protein